jgi:hypothetical protein
MFQVLVVILINLYVNLLLENKNNNTLKKKIIFQT